MITGFLFISIITFVAVLSYRRPRLERKVFKNIPLVDWLNILGFPPLVYIGLVLIIVNILNRPKVEILDFDDFILLIIGVLFLVLAFMGQSIHFVSKVLSRYLSPDKHSLQYKVNEIFHGKLSHYLVIINSLLMIFVLDLLEINHPLHSVGSNAQSILIVAAGILCGTSTTKMVIYARGWYGGYYRPVFSLVFIISLVLLGIFKFNDLRFSNYQVNLFSLAAFLSVIFIFTARQLFIFAKLSEKRKLHFIVKLFNP